MAKSCENCRFYLGAEFRAWQIDRLAAGLPELEKKLEFSQQTGEPKAVQRALERLISQKQRNVRAYASEGPQLEDIATCTGMFERLVPVTDDEGAPWTKVEWLCGAYALAHVQGFLLEIEVDDQATIEPPRHRLSE